MLRGDGDASDRRQLLAGMAAYGAIGGGLFAAGPRLSAERASGWLRQLRATPLSPFSLPTSGPRSASQTPSGRGRR